MLLPDINADIHPPVYPLTRFTFFCACVSLYKEARAPQTCPRKR